MKSEIKNGTKQIHVTYTVFDYILSVLGRMDGGRTAYKLWTLSRRFVFCSGMSVIILKLLWKYESPPRGQWQHLEIFLVVAPSG